MKRVISLLFAAIIAVGMCGCGRHLLCGQRADNGGQGGLLGGARSGEGGICDRLGRDRNGPPAGAPGPQTGQVTYPYYTLHGPRDFLQENPRSIGP